MAAGSSRDHGSGAPQSRVLVLYGRPVCSLCDEAKIALAPLLRRLELDLQERNVESDPDWERRFGEQVPVGFFRGRKMFKYKVDPPRLERALRAALRLR